MTKVDIYGEMGGPDRFVGTIHGKAAGIIAECAATDEPFFVLRGKDIFSVMGIAAYTGLLEQYSPNDFNMMQSLIEQMERFKEWQKHNMDKVRYPD